MGRGEGTDPSVPFRPRAVGPWPPPRGVGRKARVRCRGPHARPRPALPQRPPPANRSTGGCPRKDYTS